MENYDFSGIVTAYEVPCGDGRIIHSGAFDHQADETIPMMWRHNHPDIKDVLGHGVLMVSPDPSGMRVKARFNKTKEGRRAKALVENGDIEALSIWANELEEKTVAHEKNGTLRGVKKGYIREFSLVLSGQNPGARIDDVVMHSEDPLNPEDVVTDGVIIHTTFPIEFEIEEEEEEEEVIEHQEDRTIANVLDDLTEEQEQLFNIVLHSAISGEKPTPSKSAGGSGRTVKEIYDGLSEEQKTVLQFMAGSVADQEESLSQEGDNDMPTYNIFEGDKGGNEGQDGDLHLSHEAVKQVNTLLHSAIDIRPNSLRAYFKENDVHLQHSITNISNFLPNAQFVDGAGPQWYTNRDMTWVNQVLTAVGRRPFGRFRSNYADLTAAAARAKGYVTGAQKVEEVIVALTRSTTPTTIYKLQKLDRDNIIDITEFNVVQWLKEEMRFMLQEELARAILISDGRAAGADKIVETNIRPIYSDDATYTILRYYNDVGNLKLLSAMTAAETVALIDDIAAGMEDYRGAGSPTFYCQPAVYSKFMLVRDSNNQRLHRTKAELAAALDVADVVKIPPMAGNLVEDDVVDPTGLPAGTYDLDTLGVIVNLRDYVIGQDRGGQVSFFDDFDIDYNKYTYLYETRLSGAMVNPKSAITIKLVTEKSA